MSDQQKPAQEIPHKPIKLRGEGAKVFFAQVTRCAEFPRCFRVTLMGESGHRILDQGAVQFV